MNNTTLAARASLSAGVLLTAMLALSLIYGITQQAFEFVKPAPQYAAELLQFAAPLRLILSFDNLFIVAYTLGTFYFCRVLRERQSDATLLRVTLALVVAGGILDLAENLHILAMLRAAEQGIPLSAGQIELQAILSAVKWHFAYAAFLIIGVAMKPRGILEKIFVLSLIAVQMPVGVLVYTVPTRELSQLFQVLRYGNLLAGFFMIAWFCRR